MKQRNVFRSIGGAVLAAMLVFNSNVPAFAEEISVTLKSESSKTIEYQGQKVALSEHALYVNARLEAENEYEFKTLQSAVSAAKPGTKEEPTVIYLEPDVYWTDDYTNPQDRQSDDLIGLIIPQSYITLAGMTGNPDDVIIASDRGQNAGANGNFNTIGVADGFHAKDITIGNYCNVDLNYTPDPAKSHSKRQESITQAQAVTKVPGITDMDEWYFEHSNIISRLNLFSRDDRPQRSLLKDCHLECTDDSLGTGYITIFENCTFDLYSNTPCGGASFYMQAYLGCSFTTHLSDNKTITLCKNTKPFAFIDSAFKGDMKGMEWKPSNLSDDLRQIVTGNTLNGKELLISPSKPELSVTPDDKQMEAFKYNGEYNIYNLLNGAGYDEWDPLGQKDRVPSGAWNIQFDYEGETKDVTPALEGDNQASIEIKPVVLGGTDKSVTWSVKDNTLYIEPQKNGSVIVKGNNNGKTAKPGCLIATASNGMQKVLNFNITPAIAAAPAFKENPELAVPENGKISVKYILSEIADGITDNSQVNWYRAAASDGSDKTLIAQTAYVKENAAPFVSYTLRPSDVGNYIFCEVIPQTSNSEAGKAYITKPSEIIKDTQIADSEKKAYDVDLEHLAYIRAENGSKENNYEWIKKLESGNWYGGFYLPAEYREDGSWHDKAYEPKDEVAYTYAAGDSGAKGTYGLQTTTQGARLVYVDNTPRKDMKMTVDLSPHKTSAQGFGSAKQYMDIYFKYDALTMSGYGLRIARVPEISDPLLADYAAKSCTFTLMEYNNGIAAPISNSIVSTTFLPGCSIIIEMSGKVLTADVTTTSAQDSAYPADMPHEVHLSHTFTGDVNSYSGFGFQHTGTAGTGKSGNRTTIHSIKVEVPQTLTIKGKEDIPKVIEEYLPYTWQSEQGLSAEQLKTLTNNLLSETEIAAMAKNPEALKNVGIDVTKLSRQNILTPVKNPIFKDVNSSDWTGDYIKKAGQLGIADSQPDGSFAPDKSVKITETFTLLDKVLLLNHVTESRLPRSIVEKYITDKSQKEFYSTASVSSKLSERTLKILSKSGDIAISRELFAQVLFEVTKGKLKEVKEVPSFEDTYNSWYKEALDYCAGAGLLYGTSDTRMSPKKDLSRAEIMTILVRLNDLLK